MSISPSDRRQPAAATLGLCPRRERGRPRPITTRYGRPRRCAVAIPWLCAGAASGAALRDCAQRRRIFLGVASGAGSWCGPRCRRAGASGSCCGPAFRSPAQSQARMNKPRAAVRLSAKRWENSMRSARECDRRGRRIHRCFPDSRAHGGSAAQIGAAVVVHLRLG